MVDIRRTCLESLQPGNNREHPAMPTFANGASPCNHAFNSGKMGSVALEWYAAWTPRMGKKLH
jgi:hypothetical protein